MLCAAWVGASLWPVGAAAQAPAETTEATAPNTVAVDTDSRSFLPSGSRGDALMLSIVLGAVIAVPCLLLARHASIRLDPTRASLPSWLLGGAALSIALFWAVMLVVFPREAAHAWVLWAAALPMQVAGHALLIALLRRMGSPASPAATAKASAREAPARPSPSPPSPARAEAPPPPTPVPPTPAPEPEARRASQPTEATAAATAKSTTPAPVPATVFISYRRADSSDVTGRIHDRLVESLGRENVFNDVDSIPLGVDFRQHVAAILERSDCLLTVIGPDWLGAADGQGQRRLDAPTDLVRIEIETALARGVPVIPLLVRGAAMPTETDLPASLRALAFRNGMAVRPNPDFHRDLDRLEQQLHALAERRAQPQSAPSPPSR